MADDNPEPPAEGVAASPDEEAAAAKQPPAGDAAPEAAEGAVGGEAAAAADTAAEPADAESGATEAEEEDVGDAGTSVADEPSNVTEDEDEGDAEDGTGEDAGPAGEDSEPAGVGDAEGGEGDPESMQSKEGDTVHNDDEDSDEDTLVEDPGSKANWRENINTQQDVVSFWKATTGYRPESAEIAKRIEGFHDDFKYEEEKEEEDEEEEEEEEDDDDAGPDYHELIEEQASIRAELKEANNVLQRKVLMIFEKQHKQKIMDDDPKGNNKLDAGYEVRFQAAITKWKDLLDEEDRIKQHYQAITFDHKARLEERAHRAREIQSAFRGFKIEVARSAEHSKTGRAIPENKIMELDALEMEKEEEVEGLRLRNIFLKAQMRKLESKIRDKEQLAEGLHLIDFEQLKIENQSLNEKIEERNEELLKLRKKTTATVQVLTHIKEKLQFVEKENMVLAQKLSHIEKELKEKRDKLQRVKTERDKLRSEAVRMKENSSYVSKDALLEDVETQVEKRELLLQNLAEVKAMHAATTERVGMTTQKILKMTEILNTPGSGMYEGVM